MNFKSLLIASAATVAVASPSFAAEKNSVHAETTIERDAKGNYDEKNKTEKTDAAGTTTTNKENVEVDVHANGDVENTLKREKTVDPRGLLNKRTTKVTETQDVNHDGSSKTTHKKVVDGKTVESETQINK